VAGGVRGSEWEGRGVRGVSGGGDRNWGGRGENVVLGVGGSDGTQTIPYI